MATINVNLQPLYSGDFTDEFKQQSLLVKMKQQVLSNRNISVTDLQKLTPEQTALLALYAAQSQSYYSLVSINDADIDYKVLDKQGRNVLLILLDECLSPNQMVIKIIFDCIAKGASLHCADNQGRTANELLFSPKWESYVIDIFELLDKVSLQKGAVVGNGLGLNSAITQDLKTDENNWQDNLSVEVYIVIGDESLMTDPSEDETDGIRNIIQATKNSLTYLRRKLERRQGEDSYGLMRHRAPIAREQVASATRSDWDVHDFDPLSYNVESPTRESVKTSIHCWHMGR